MGLAEYIMAILRSDTRTVMSWGFHSPSAIQNGLRFCVNGFIHKGLVEVVYDEGTDLFNVRTLTNDVTVVKSEESIYIDSLVSVIDMMVEKDTSDTEYRQKVKDLYGI